MSKSVVVYTQPDCGACAKVKEFLNRNEVAYSEKNIREDRDALAELLDRGFRSTPVTLIDGEPVVGYAPDELEKLLDLGG